MASVAGHGTWKPIIVAASIAAGGVGPGVGAAGAQGRDGLLNGALIGAGAGAAAGVAFTHAVRDSDLTFGQYMRGALIFGAIGASAGLGVDALLNREPSGPPTARRTVLVTPAASAERLGVVVKWTWGSHTGAYGRAEASGHVLP